MLVGHIALRENMRHSNKGLDEIKKGNFQEAERYLEKVFSIEPNNIRM